MPRRYTAAGRHQSVTSLAAAASQLLTAARPLTDHNVVTDKQPPMYIDSTAI